MRFHCYAGAFAVYLQTLYLLYFPPNSTHCGSEHMNGEKGAILRYSFTPLSGAVKKHCWWFLKEHRTSTFCPQGPVTAATSNIGFLSVMGRNRFEGPAISLKRGGSGGSRGSLPPTDQSYDLERAEPQGKACWKSDLGTRSYLTLMPPILSKSFEYCILCFCFVLFYKKESSKNIEPKI